MIQSESHQGRDQAAKESHQLRQQGASHQTRIILVRHGETDWNVTHKLQGITDTKLTETGVKQAQRAASRLAKRRQEISAIYSSSLSRALSTAQAIARACEVEIESIGIESRLREFDLGIFAAHTQAEARAKFPLEWNEHLINDSYVVPEGESYSNFIERVTSSLKDIVAKHEGGTVCVVTHGGVIDCAKTYLVQGDGPLDGRCGNASLNEFIVDESGVWTIARWNDVSHLAALHKEVLLADDVVQHPTKVPDAI